ncbi:MAG: tRNA (guanosine(46)-N7)-methyltransferase TrmB [Planctomycetaceae bacterium]|nr:tRNA (guanosine(46)-N7)-methyltransferase TrmB [Planctomycetaceae bacterium]
MMTSELTDDVLDEDAPDPRRDLFPYFRTVADLPGVIDWTEFFGNDHPVELDIGCGRGMYLFNAVMTQPEINFLGLELDYKEGRRGARRLQKRALPNGRVIGGDAREVLQKRIVPHSVSKAHVYFPDPWWKRKHRKRRLFTDEFVAMLATVVKPGGEVHSWTDVEDYFEVIAGLMNHAEWFTPLAPPEGHTPQHDMDYLTSFHRRRTQAGAPTFRGRWQRR